MPSTMIHLVIANKIIDRIDTSHSGEFYLGVIAPDAVNVNGKAPKEIRYCAHLRSTDYNEWINNVLEFSKNNANIKKKTPDFFKGFLIHILTDIAWDQIIQPKLFELMKSSGIDETKLNEKKWNELLAFDKEAVKLEVWREKIRPRLKSAYAPCGFTVDKKDIDEYKNSVVDMKFIPPNTQTSFGLISDDMINTAAKQVFELYESLRNAQNSTIGIK